MWELTKMDENKLFEELAWADLLIIQDEPKAIWEFQVKQLKHKDLCAVCSHLKIKGVKDALKEVMLQKIVSIYKVKERYGKLVDNVEIILSTTRKEPQCLIECWTLCSLKGFLKAWPNFGMWLIAELDAGKASNNQLFW